MKTVSRTCCCVLVILILGHDRGLYWERRFRCCHKLVVMVGQIPDLLSACIQIKSVKVFRPVGGTRAWHRTRTIYRPTLSRNAAVPLRRDGPFRTRPEKWKRSRTASGLFLVVTGCVAAPRPRRSGPANKHPRPAHRADTPDRGVAETWTGSRSSRQGVPGHRTSSRFARNRQHSFCRARLTHPLHTASLQCRRHAGPCTRRG